MFHPQYGCQKTTDYSICFARMARQPLVCYLEQKTHSSNHANKNPCASLVFHYACAMRILSGIQPSGALHLGNYFGMMRPAIELQEKGEALYFIADYHSMTSLFNADERRKNTLDVALDFLACGLDPKKSVFFKQSDVPEVTELAWMPASLPPMGLLERCTSYKDKI